MSFSQALRRDRDLLRCFVARMAEVFHVLSEARIVHADIKPDNILVDFEGNQIQRVKLIDFGSAFAFDSPGNVSLSTPEYMAPEVLEYVENRSNAAASQASPTHLCQR